MVHMYGIILNKRIYFQKTKVGKVVNWLLRTDLLAAVSRNDGRVERDSLELRYL